jgi:hypothetical protein
MNVTKIQLVNILRGKTLGKSKKMTFMGKKLADLVGYLSK